MRKYSAQEIANRQAARAKKDAAFEAAAHDKYAQRAAEKANARQAARKAILAALTPEQRAALSAEYKVRGGIVYDELYKGTPAE